MNNVNHYVRQTMDNNDNDIRTTTETLNKLIKQYNESENYGYLYDAKQSIEDILELSKINDKLTDVYIRLGQ